MTNFSSTGVCVFKVCRHGFEWARACKATVRSGKDYQTVQADFFSFSKECRGCITPCQCMKGRQGCCFKFKALQQWHVMGYTENVSDYQRQHKAPQSGVQVQQRQRLQERPRHCRLFWQLLSDDHRKWRGQHAGKFMNQSPLGYKGLKCWHLDQAENLHNLQEWLCTVVSHLEVQEAAGFSRSQRTVLVCSGQPVGKQPNHLELLLRK